MDAEEKASGGPASMKVNERRCVRCDHPDHWHRHDDEACSKHPQPCYPDIAPFRCLGYDCDGPGFAAGTAESRCGCPDFVATPDDEDLGPDPTLAPRMGVNRTAGGHGGER